MKGGNADEFSHCNNFVLCITIDYHGNKMAYFTLFSII